MQEIYKNDPPPIPFYLSVLMMVLVVSNPPTNQQHIIKLILICNLSKHIYYCRI